MRHHAIVPREDPVLVLASEVGALVAERGGKQALDVIGNFDGGLAACAGEFLREFVQEVNLVHWAGIQVAEEWVHGFVAPRGGAVEHVGVGLECDGDDSVAELGEEGAEAEQEGLPACCSFWAECKLSVA